MKKYLLLISVFIFSSSLFTFCEAQYTVLHSFNDTNGAYPNGSLTLSGSVLYGMTHEGGANNVGVIFSINTNGSGYTILHKFNDTNGANPFYGSLTLSDSVLYGMTYSGGVPYNDGVIFSVNTNGSGYTDLIDFGDTNNGMHPGGSLTLSGNVLYGMTTTGGYGFGNIFSVNTNGNRYTVLHNFNTPNGEFPYGNLTLSGSVLYGMTSQGGTYNYGTIFSIDSNGNGYTVLHNFNGTAGFDEWGSLTLSGSVLYGMASYGGANDSGIIFSININGSGYTVLHNFNGTNGSGPIGSLVLSGSLLYGMTYSGGVPYDDGVIFSIDTSGSRYNVLYDFNTENGTEPPGNLVLSGGILYGMTSKGGASGYGVIFGFDTNTSSTSVNELNVTSNSINVYPNPSSGQFTIQSSVISGQSSVEIYNVLGEKVYSNYQITKSSNYQINLSSQPNGIYFYRVIAESGELIGEGKLVIQK